jgi:hypothetical protein
MFGNNNFEGGFNFSSGFIWKNKSTADRSHPSNQLISGYWTPEVISYIDQNPISPSIPSNCMGKYNPHNALHEHHATNGGCVSEARIFKGPTDVVNQVIVPCVTPGMGATGTHPTTKGNTTTPASTGVEASIGTVVEDNTKKAMGNKYDVKYITHIEYYNPFLKAHSASALLSLYNAGGIEAVNKALEGSDLGLIGDEGVNSMNNSDFS